MKTGIRLIAQHYDISTGDVLDESLINEENVTKAETLKELGYLHVDQIEFLQKIQDFKIKHQIILNTHNTCPVCQAKTAKNSQFISDFHSALTDHRVQVQRTMCKCGWNSPTSVVGIYGSDLHPDLLEKQALQGAKESFEKASQTLNAESAKKRPINNHSRIFKSVKQIGECLEIVKINNTYIPSKITPSHTIVAAIDGGHVKERGDKRSFEAMVANVYNPLNLRVANKNHNKLTSKTIVASAKEDKQDTMKKLFKVACLTQGMTKETHVVCLADRAENCWSIAQVIKDDCKEHTFILDWFHISMKFKNISIPEAYEDIYERAKWNLWNGQVAKSIKRLIEIRDKIEDDVVVNKIMKLMTYIDNNKKNIVNYDERKNNGLVFTSNQAEGTVNTLINTRQKGKQKMLWSREGAHNVLQIRSSILSDSWKNDWRKVEAQIYKKAA